MSRNNQTHFQSHRNEQRVHPNSITSVGFQAPPRQFHQPFVSTANPGPPRWVVPITEPCHAANAIQPRSDFNTLDGIRSLDAGRSNKRQRHEQDRDPDTILLRERQIRETRLPHTIPTHVERPILTDRSQSDRHVLIARLNKDPLYRERVRTLKKGLLEVIREREIEQKKLIRAAQKQKKTDTLEQSEIKKKQDELDAQQRILDEQAAIAKEIQVAMVRSFGKTETARRTRNLLQAVQNVKATSLA